MKIVNKKGSDQQYALYENGLMLKVSKADAAKLVPNLHQHIVDLGADAFNKLVAVNKWVRKALGQDPDGGGIAS